MHLLKSKGEKWKKYSINSISAFLFIWIMIMLIIGHKIDYFCKVTRKVYNAKLLIIGLLIIVAIVLLHSMIKNKINEIDLDKFIKIFSCVFCILQIFIGYNIFFETGWDSGYYIIPTAKIMLEKGDIWKFVDYYQMYPNNLLMVNIFIGF